MSTTHESNSTNHILNSNDNQNMFVSNRSNKYIVQKFTYVLFFIYFMIEILNFFNKAIATLIPNNQVVNSNHLLLFNLDVTANKQQTNSGNYFVNQQKKNSKKIHYKARSYR